MATRLRPRLEDEVERGLGGAAEAGEPAFGHHRAQAPLACLSAQRQPDLLVERRRRADHRRRAIEHAPDRVEVLLDAIARVGLDGSVRPITRDAATSGYELDAAGPEEFAAFVRAEIAKWGKVIKDANIKIE